VPVEADSSSPTFAVPEIAGGAVFAGALDDDTTWLVFELADDCPSAFDAVTETRTV
jgi:hypothetical protein